eukprot:6360816-Heterocapsa_arctica.AAC.1
MLTPVGSNAELITPKPSTTKDKLKGMQPNYCCVAAYIYHKPYKHKDMLLNVAMGKPPAQIN